MGRKATILIIVAVALVAVSVGIFARQAAKWQHTSSAVTGSAQTQAKPNPFRSAVVELTFSSRSVHDGVEFLSAAGRRIEYIDVTGGRRREDYTSTDTAMSQLTTNTAVTWIFDGSHLYAMIDHNNKREGHVVEMREGYGGTIWGDAAVEELKLPGATISEEEFVGRPCKVYEVIQGPYVRKWWVWNGVTLRSESHQEIQTKNPNTSEIENTVLDTSEEAVRIEQDVDIDPGMFIPPSDVTYEPADAAAIQRYKHLKTAPWLRMGPEIDIF